MTDTKNFVVGRTNSDVEAENSGTEELKSNSESDWQESEWIHQIRSGLKAPSAGSDVPIMKLPASLRTPVERFTPRQWQFGLHNRDPQASGSESQVLKIRLAAACKLNPDEWDKFCHDVVDNPEDMMLKSYGYSNGFSRKEVRYLLTLDALKLVLVLSSIPSAVKLIDLFIDTLVHGGFNIEVLLDGVSYYRFLDDLYLCENQIPMVLMKKVITQCYGLLPDDEWKNKNAPELRELKDLDSTVTEELLVKILKAVAEITCYMFFSEPCPDEIDDFSELIDINYKVGKLENCAHVFACIHKVMTTCVESPTDDKKSPATDTEILAPDVNQQFETDVEALPTVGNPIAVTTTFERAKQLFLPSVATSSKQFASVIAKIFGFSREPATEKGFAAFQLIQSATDLKKAGLQIKGIPGMVQQVAFKNGCLLLPIMSHSENIESYICNMAAYEFWNTEPPFQFIDYLQLMSQLIRTPEDVSYLVKCYVIRPYHGTQQRIFQMWERLQIGLWFAGYSDQYIDNIVTPINRHRASALNLMVIDFYITYCSKPWLAISLISAIILLVATLIQTDVLVIGSDKMQPHFPRGG